VNHFKWLIVVEGSTDVELYEKLLDEYGVKDFTLFHARGKWNVLDMSTWHKRISMKYKADLQTFVDRCLGMSGFLGILLVVDSDTDKEKVFKRYVRNQIFPYESDELTAPKEIEGYYELDRLKGTTTMVPIRGIHVPFGKDGCLESDLIKSLGFPLDTHEEYGTIKKIARKISKEWKVPLKNGIHWLDENEIARFDKFIYTAFSKGIEACTRYEIKLPKEPEVIENIRKAMI